MTCLIVCRYGLFAALSGLVKQDLKPYMEKIVHYLLLSLKSTEGVTVSERVALVRHTSCSCACCAGLLGLPVPHTPTESK